MPRNQRGPVGATLDVERYLQLAEALEVAMPWQKRQLDPLVEPRRAHCQKCGHEYTSDGSRVRNCPRCAAVLQRQGRRVASSSAGG